MTFLRLNAGWIPAILFGVMLLEGILFTTFLFSGSVICLAAGALVQIGVVGYFPVFLAIFTGFWVGDGINFMLGHRGETWVKGLAMVQSRPQLLARAETLIKKWGITAIFVSRFLGPTRPFVTLLAGVMHMSQLAFHTATVVSTLLLTWGLLNAGMTGVVAWNALK